MDSAPQEVSQSTRGRKDGQQEAAIRLDPVKEEIERLVRLATTAKEAGDDLADGIKAVAERSGILAKNLRAYVNARANEKLEERRRDWEQLSLLAEEIA